MQHRRSIRVRSVVLAFAVAIMGVVTGVGASPAYAATDYWVAPTGADTNGGTQTAPFKTLQKALDVAQPGTTINLKVLRDGNELTRSVTLDTMPNEQQADDSLPLERPRARRRG